MFKRTFIKYKSIIYYYSMHISVPLKWDTNAILYIIILRIKKISKSTLAEDMINRIASLSIPNQILQPLKS